MTPAEIQSVLEKLVALNPDALLFEPRDFYDLAVVGYTNEPKDHWTRPSPSPYVAIYDYEELIHATLKMNGLEEPSVDDFAEAQEWVDFNTVGAWVGEGTPTIQYSGDWAHDDGASNADVDADG